MNTVRVVLELRDDGTQQLRTNDLAAFTIAFGADLLNRFCACYLLADRLKTIYHFLQSVLPAAKVHTPAGRRDFLTLYAFAASTLKELSLRLGDLRSALVQQGLWERTSWRKHLQRWEDWGQDSVNSDVRNQLATHVDLEVLQAGLAALQPADGPAVITEGIEKAAETWCALSHYCLVAALGLKDEDVSGVICSTAELLDPGEGLDDQFLHVLDRRGLSRIVCRVRGAKPRAK